MTLAFVVVIGFVGLIGFLAGKASFWNRDKLATAISVAGLAALVAAFPPSDWSGEFLTIIGFGIALWAIANIAYRNGAGE